MAGAKPQSEVSWSVWRDDHYTSTTEYGTGLGKLKNIHDSILWSSRHQYCKCTLYVRIRSTNTKSTPEIAKAEKLASQEKDQTR